MEQRSEQGAGDDIRALLLGADFSQLSAEPAGWWDTMLGRRNESVAPRPTQR